METSFYLQSPTIDPTVLKYHHGSAVSSFRRFQLSSETSTERLRCRLTEVQASSVEMRRALLTMHRLASEYEQQLHRIRHETSSFLIALGRILQRPQSAGTDWCAVLPGQAARLNSMRLAFVSKRLKLLLFITAKEDGFLSTSSSDAGTRLSILPALGLVLDDEVEADYQRLLRRDTLPSTLYFVKLGWKWTALLGKLIWAKLGGRCGGRNVDAQEAGAAAWLVEAAQVLARSDASNWSTRRGAEPTWEQVLGRGVMESISLDWEIRRSWSMEEATFDAILDFVLRWNEWRRARRELVEGSRG